MVYFFVNKDGTEGCANEIPEKGFNKWKTWKNVYRKSYEIVTLPKGTIEKLIGKKLTWEDEVYEYIG